MICICYLVKERTNDTLWEYAKKENSIRIANMTQSK